MQVNIQSIKFTSKLKYLVLLTVILFIRPAAIFGQKQAKHYSQNFILKGTIYNLHEDSILSNGCVWAIAFQRIYTVYTNAKGEYEIKFYDTTESKPYNSFSTPEGEIVFIWCEDPNRTKSVFLKKTKVKKSRKPEKKGNAPIIVKRNVLIEYEFEKKHKK